MKKISMVIIMLLVLTSTVYAYAGQPHFTLQLESPESIFIDEILQTNISVKDYVYGKENPTSAIDFSIFYNPEHFEYMGAVLKDGTHINVVQSVYGNVSEDVYENQRVLISMIGSINSITEDSDVISLKFKPKNIAYETPFTLHSVKAATSTGLVFTPDIEMRKITIANIYDVNKDGIVNLGDLAIVSYNVGNDVKKHYYADVNRDGVIDKDDVDMIMNHILK